MNNFYRFALGSSVFFPVIAFAATIEEILNVISGIFSILVPLLITLGLIYFIWGVAKFILSGDDAGARAEGRGMMINGIIALFVIISVWGLVAVLNETFSIDQGGSVQTPQIPGGSGGFDFGGFNF